MQNKILSLPAVLLTLTFTAFAQLPDSIPSQGLVIGMRDGLPIVEKVYFGTAGATAGFQRGDAILAIGDSTTAGMTPRDVGYALDFNPGSTIGVAIQRNGAPQYLILNRRLPKEQWKVAYKQDKMAKAARRMASTPSPCDPYGQEGSFSVGDGQISYSSPTIQQRDSIVTYEGVVSEMIRIRQELAALTNSVDELNSRVDQLGAPSYYNTEADSDYGLPPLDDSPMPDTVLPPPPPYEPYDEIPMNVDTMDVDGSNFGTDPYDYYDSTPAPDAFPKKTHSQNYAPPKSDPYPKKTRPQSYASESAQVNDDLPNDQKNPIAEWWNNMPENDMLRNEFDTDAETPEMEIMQEELDKVGDWNWEDVPEDQWFEKTDPAQGHPVNVDHHNSKHR